MPFLTWNDQYTIGVSTVDVQHKKLFDLVNQMHDAMRTGQGNEVVGKILGDLVAYTRLHFAAEERLMAEAGYADLQRHRAEHEELAGKAADLLQQFRNGRGMMTIQVMNFLKDWLSKHIMASDKKYAPYVQRKTGASAPGLR